MPTIAVSTRTILAPPGHAGGTPRNQQHFFLEAGAHGIHGHQVPGLVLAGGSDGPDDKQFLALQTRSLRVATTVPTTRT